MLKAIGAFLAPYKLFLYIGLASCIAGAWVWDRHAQYNKGVAACELKQSEARAEYWEQRSTRLAEEGAVALEKERLVGAEVNERKSNRRAEVEKTRELEESNPDGACVWTDDELRDIQQAVRAANQ